MPDYRSYSEELAGASGEVQLNAFESHHLIKVNRARKGERVRLFNGKGCESDAELVGIDLRGARLSIVTKKQLPEPKHKIILIQAMPKGKTFEQEIRRMTELGVWEIFPLRTEHSGFSHAEAHSRGREIKWQAAAVEGAKQSGNPWIPHIHPVSEWKDWIKGAGQLKGARIMASLAPGSRSPQDLFHSQKSIQQAEEGEEERTWLLVGPEGDFTNEETQQALDAGFQPVTLGPHVLRVETAALALVVLAARW